MHGYEEVHILDTSVIIGAIKATVDRKRNKSLYYFNKVKNTGKYLTYVPPTALSEAFCVIWQEFEPSALDEAMGQLVEILTTNEHIQPFFTHEIPALLSCLEKVKELEVWCGANDAQIVAEGMLLKERLLKDPDFERLNCFLISSDRKQRTGYLDVKRVDDVE